MHSHKAHTNALCARTYEYVLTFIFVHIYRSTHIHRRRRINTYKDILKSIPILRFPLLLIEIVCLFVGCLTSQQQASVSQGRICSDNFTCCHTEIEVADPTFYLTQSQYTDIGPTSPSTDPITPGSWQGSHWSAIFCHWYDSTPKKSRRKRDSNPGSFALEADALPLGQRGGLLIERRGTACMHSL